MHMARLWDSSRQKYSLEALTTDLLSDDFQKTSMKELFVSQTLKGRYRRQVYIYTTHRDASTPQKPGKSLYIIALWMPLLLGNCI